MTSSLGILFYFLVFHGSISLPPVNLDWTDSMEESENLIGLQHDCLHVSANTDRLFGSYQTISYCLTEWPSKWAIKENEFDRKFTFADLYKQRITSEQLYLWSAPISVMERYQFYLNQQSAQSSGEIRSMERDVFYNCTSPRFGPQCQYSLDIYETHQSSLAQIVREFYDIRYRPTTLTCYMHLKCYRNSTLICLGWHEICNNIVDCLNDGVDERDCWQMKVKACEENEHRCQNGQCIPKESFRDHDLTPDCLDESDQPYIANRDLYISGVDEPTFLKEESQIVSYESPSAVRLGLWSSVMERNELLKMMTFVETPTSMSDDCWSAFKCKYNLEPYLDSECQADHIDQCPDILLMPAAPIRFGHMYFAYWREDVRNQTHSLKPHYVCYDDRFCQGFSSNSTWFSFRNLTCRKPEEFPSDYEDGNNDMNMDFYIRTIGKQFYQCNTIIYNDSTICQHSSMYQCLHSSKCISIDRLCDGRNDCNDKDDEHCPLLNGQCSIGESTFLFKCILAQKCVSIYLVNDGNCDCRSIYSHICDDESYNVVSGMDLVSFASICNGYTELFPLTIDGRNESDESECEYWQCNNTYTRCDERWNCFDGADEIDCPLYLPSVCPPGHHLCVAPHTYKFICLPLKQANDGQIDCVGATDEPKLCRLTETINAKNFFCKNDPVHLCISSADLCAENNRCLNGEDEQLCYPTRNITGSRSICELDFVEKLSPIQSFFCQRYTDGYLDHMNGFSLEHMQYPTVPFEGQVQSSMMAHSSQSQTKNVYEQRCHRGLPLRVWTDREKNVSTAACLCPPSYYGETCQYENQRISFTVQFQAYSDSRRTLFTFLVSLIDNDHDARTIYSYQQHTYHYMTDCSMKYNIYLLYPTRPRHLSSNYSIHIDMYEKVSLAYRGSFSIPVDFPFLPVNRIAVQLTIPRKRTTIESCSDPSCRNGHCLKYVGEHQSRTFCQCKQGWSGRSCTIPHRCQCSSNALCAGISAMNQSVCVCPIGTWGSRCLLHSDPCQSLKNESICLNGGQCLPNDKQLTMSETFICICRKGFSGDQCQNVDTSLTLSFDEEIVLPQSLIVHFIDGVTQQDDLPANSSSVRTMTVYQRSITIYPKNRFHIAIAQLFDQYYLIVVQKQHTYGVSYNRTIRPLDRCQHLSEVLNETIVSLHPLRRMKYYQIPCEQFAPALNCFYDEHYFCLCYSYNGRRLSNCFTFDSKAQQTCYGLSDCENGAQCIQDHPTCPQSSICLCPMCFHGTRCQFSSHLFGLSLDAILGYHIQPHINLVEQSSIIKTSLVLTVIIVFAGLINATLSILTFKNKASRESGCGLYLLGSSIAIALTMIILVMKFSILLYAQMTYLTDHVFLNVQCYILDFLLQIGLNLDQYLNACVAGDRAFTVIKATGFHRKKSQRMAKYLLVGVLFWLIATTIPDPIHRRLLDDANDDEEAEQRIWCIVTYPSSVRIFSSISNSIHFFFPFLVNSISAVIILIITTRQRKRAQRKHAYQQIFHEQFQEHKHLLIAPIVLVILATPRLILSFVSTCMQSSSQVWLPLIGYYISFVPSTLTMLIFVCPSNFYTKEFQKSLQQIRNQLICCFQRRLQ